MKDNVFDQIPKDLSNEIFQDIVKHENVRIERIVSLGHSSPDVGWYDQQDNEWVIVLQGSGTICFENGESCTLTAGDYLNIPAHTKHKVTKTDRNVATIWLAIFY